MRGALITLGTIAYVGLGLMILANLELYSRLKECSDNSGQLAHDLWEERCRVPTSSDLYCQRNP